jgi:hypothetical protein
MLIPGTAWLRFALMTSMSALIPGDAVVCWQCRCIKDLISITRIIISTAGDDVAGYDLETFLSLIPFDPITAAAIKVLRKQTSPSAWSRAESSLFE